MTFPKIELLCAECKEPMTLVNKPELLDCNEKGFDKMVEYHYQCHSNARHKDDNWCWTSRDEHIQIFKIYIPKL